MNIQSINTSIKYNNNFNNTAKYAPNFHTKPIEFDKVEFHKASKIPFRGFEKNYYLLQANRLKKESEHIAQRGINTYSVAPSLIDISNEIKDDSDSILSASEILFNDICALVLNGENNHFHPILDNNSNIVIDYYFDDDNDLTIEEYDKKGDVGRKTVILKDSIISVEMGKNEDENEAYRFDKKTGQLTDYYFDFEYEDLQESYDSDERFRFENGRLVAYDKDYKKTYNGKEKSSEHINYNDERLATYSLGWKHNKKNSEKAEELFMFSNNKLRRYYANIKFANSCCKSADCMYRYDENGDLIKYGEYLYTDDYAKTNNMSTLIEYHHESPKKVWQNRTYCIENGELSANTIYEYNSNGKAKKCSLDFIKEEGKEAKISKEIVFSEEDENANI